MPLIATHIVNSKIAKYLEFPTLEAAKANIHRVLRDHPDAFVYDGNYSPFLIFNGQVVDVTSRPKNERITIAKENFTDELVMRAFANGAVGTTAKNEIASILADVEAIEAMPQQTLRKV